LKLFLLTFFTLSLFAQTQEKYPFIQPVSVEIAPIKAEAEFLQKQETKATEPKKNIKTDSDKDGILDSADICPDTAEGFIVDASGCPVASTLKVNFDSNSNKISNKYINDFKEFAQFLLQNKEYQVLIYGFSDTFEDDKESKVLSQKRANAVKESLIQNGVSSTKLTAIGRGEESPVADNETEDGRSQNRRIEIEIIP
jgi:outer membrane protein OmpA-like peptidoglycan-associated protein